MKSPNRKIPTISEAEWNVMRIIWQSDRPRAAGEVVEALAADHHWSPRTIKTMLGRLARKGALEFQEQGNRYLYSARVSMEQCLQAESGSFLNRVFDGAAAAMLSYFVKNSHLSAEEIAQLRKQLSSKEGKP